MANTLQEKVKAKIDGSVIATEPFPFLYVPNFFPADYYERIESIFPSEQYITPINSKQYQALDIILKERSTLTIFNRIIGYQEIENYPHKENAKEMRKWFAGFLIPLIANKLNIQLPAVWDDDTRFVVDYPGYVKRPHTDIPQKIFSILIYMSESKSGTTILKPKQQGFSDDYGYDHQFDQFEEVFDPPFRPNTLLAFPRTDTSFHCVKKIGQGEYRRAIHINIRC